MPSTSIYLTPDELYIYKRFKQIVKREGSNVSRNLMGYIKEYVDVHDPGNPQSRMTSFAQGGSVDIGAIEGEIRQIFKARGDKGILLNYKDIYKFCKNHFTSSKQTKAVCDRVCEWLSKVGVKVWR